MFLSRHMLQCQRNHPKKNKKNYWNQPELGIGNPPARPATNKPALTQKSWLLHLGVSSCFIQQVITSAQVKHISDASCLTHCEEAPLMMPLLLVGHHKICICVNKQAWDRHVSLNNLLVINLWFYLHLSILYLYCFLCMFVVSIFADFLPLKPHHLVVLKLKLNLGHKVCFKQLRHSSLSFYVSFLLGFI